MSSEDSIPLAKTLRDLFKQHVFSEETQFVGGGLPAMASIQSLNSA
ncbi:hypothetical protein [Pseudomonas viridiflava]|nr:hypothetical protein [Pseudomonas viridiflava]